MTNLPLQTFLSAVMITSALSIESQQRKFDNDDRALQSIRKKNKKAKDVKKCPSECTPTYALDAARDRILNNEVIMTDDSCTVDENGSIALKYRYIPSQPTTPTPKETSDGDIAAVPQPPGMINPNPDIDPWDFIFGLSIEVDSANDYGVCVDLPDAIHGPFGSKEVEECTPIMQSYCDDIQASMCPCFDIDTVLDLQKEIADDKSFVLDMSRSCKLPELNDDLPYGIYKKVGVEGESFRIIGTDVLADKTLPPYYGKCSNKTKRLFPDLTLDQSQHCIGLVDYICSSLKIELPVDECTDDKDFRMDDKEYKSCEIMFPKEVYDDSYTIQKNQNKKNRTCKKGAYKRSFYRRSNKFVFQYCRESCGTCSCGDSPDYYYNGQADKGCDWLAQNPELCEDKDAAKFCKSACNSPCCRDDEEFEFEFNGRSGRKCDSLQSDWPEACASDSDIPIYCPMSCRKCLIQPRG
mmetsp:Transcript_4121/g.4757  ORF Transcript_4121/g.4757 Transcript_4121/m.4757 type:complete len:466 (-) Transcript_4121:3421-4818(-)